MLNKTERFVVKQIEDSIREEHENPAISSDLFTSTVIHIGLWLGLVLHSGKSLFGSLEPYGAVVFWVLAIMGIVWNLFFLEFNTRYGGKNKIGYYFLPCMITAKSLFVASFHKYAPGRSERDREIDEFRAVLIRAEAAAQPEAKILPLVQQLKENPDLFLETYFQKSQSFKRMFLERVSDEGEVFSGNVLFLLLLPRVKTIGLDHLREMVIAANFREELDYCIDDMIDLFPQKHKIDDLFEHFTDQEIKSVFTRRYDPEDYIDLLKDSFSLNLQDNRLIPAPTLDRVIDDASVTKEFRDAKLTHKFLLKIEPNLPKYKVKVLLLKSEFMEGGKAFSNCVRSYYNSPDQDCFTLSSFDNTPLACVRVKDGEIVEMSGYRNAPLSSQITEEIDLAFKKAKTA